MNRINDYTILKNDIVKWLRNYIEKYDKIKAFVVGVSGGIDSAVVSTLCAETGIPTHVINMPIYQKIDQESLSDIHLEYLKRGYPNIITHKFDLTNIFDMFQHTMKDFGHDKLSLANSRSRLRMVTLYQVAGSINGVVVGTGNKVEDYGVGFYTKYGDGGVDIAPIADLYKTEVWELGKYLGVDNSIISANPTDGLWDDGRTDEDQIGCSYKDLEEAMEYGTGPGLNILNEFNKQNNHKMIPIPTFKL
jgi:NAD+ synthase